MGARYCAKEGERWRPTRLVRWLGFEVDARNGVVRMEERNVNEGRRLRDEILGARPGSTIQARELLASVSFLIFLHWSSRVAFAAYFPDGAQWTRLARWTSGGPE